MVYTNHIVIKPNSKLNQQNQIKFTQNNRNMYGDRSYGNNHRATLFNFHCLTNHKTRTNNGYFSKLHFKQRIELEIRNKILLVSIKHFILNKP